MNIPLFVKYFMLSEMTALLSCESKKENVDKSSTSNGTAKWKSQQVRIKKKKKKIITAVKSKKRITRCWSEMYVFSFCSKNSGVYTGNYIVLIHKKI